MQIKVNLQIFIFIIIFIFTKQIEIYTYLMLFALIHELGHLFTGIMLGLKPKALKIMPFGVSIVFKTYEEERYVQFKNLIIAAAGPAVNAFILVIGIILNLKTNIIYANLLITIFNLIPIYPLDGGRIAKAILSLKKGEKRAQEIIIKISNVSIIILTFLTSIIILYYKNIALIFVISYLWILTIKNNKKYRLTKRIYDIIQKEKV